MPGSWPKLPAFPIKARSGCSAPPKDANKASSWMSTADKCPWHHRLSSLSATAFVPAPPFVKGVFSSGISFSQPLVPFVKILLAVPFVKVLVAVPFVRVLVAVPFVKIGPLFFCQPTVKLGPKLW